MPTCPEHSRGNGNGKPRKKDSARLVWDTKPRRAPNPKDIEFQTAEVVIPNPKTAGELPLSFRDGQLSEIDIYKQKMNHLIWSDFYKSVKLPCRVSVSSYWKLGF